MTTMQGCYATPLSLPPRIGMHSRARAMRRCTRTHSVLFSRGIPREACLQPRVTAVIILRDVACVHSGRLLTASFIEFRTDDSQSSFSMPHDYTDCKWNGTTYSRALHMRKFLKTRKNLTWWSLKRAKKIPFLFSDFP